MDTVTSESKSLVKNTFAKVAMRSETFSELFINQLYRADQSLLKLVKGSRSEQNRQFARMLATIIALIDKPEELRALASEWGVTFATSGVTKNHYHVFGRVLLATLDRVLGDSFTPQVKEAWAAFYHCLADIAIEAAHDKV